MIPQELLQILFHGERLHFECKKARREVSKSLWEIYSSFANTLGGIILLGIEEDLTATDVNKRFRILDYSEQFQTIAEIKLSPEFVQTKNAQTVALYSIRPVVINTVNYINIS